MRSFSALIILCAVVGINCYKFNSDSCNGCGNAEYTRIKRAKYYSNPPYKSYRPHYGPRGSYGHSAYTGNVKGTRSSYKPRPYKVSKKPIIQGLGDEDFNNVIKYLSHRDFNKIFELENSDKYKEQMDYYDIDALDYNDIQNVIPQTIQEDEEVANYYGTNDLGTYRQSDYYNNNNYYQYLEPRNNYPNTYEQDQLRINNMYSQIPLNEQESEHFEHVSLDEYIQQEVNEMNGMNSDGHVFTDSSTMLEEHLPKPINLREYDHDVSFTNKVPAVVKPETPSYQVENFADLPLMEYVNSRLETVNSYNVPHYSVVSSSNQRPSSSLTVPSLPPSLSSSVLSLINAPPVESAPPASVGREQSDAHLKATKIWTHKSKGTAYTLHDDGTLSLEIPTKPRYKYP